MRYGNIIVANVRMFNGKKEIMKIWGEYRKRRKETVFLILLLFVGSFFIVLSFVCDDVWTSIFFYIHFSQTNGFSVNKKKKRKKSKRNKEYRKNENG